jgi:hypothetical protein
MTIARRRAHGGGAGVVGSGAKVWLKADAITPVSDGTALSSWPDSSSSGNNAVQATGADQPLYKTAVQNGLPIVRFNGTTDLMTGADPVLGTTGFTLTLVIQATAAESYPCIVCFPASLHELRLEAGTGKLDMLNGGSVCEASTSFVGTGFHVVSGVQNHSGSTYVYVDGVQVATAAAGGYNSGAYALGSRTGGADPFQGDIAEMLIYAGPTSFTAGSQLWIDWTYLQAKWATPAL